MDALELSRKEAALVSLAITYHLGRPGSELDAQTKRPVAHGLQEVADALEPQQEAQSATIELSQYQSGRLISALSGALNELKMYTLLQQGRQTTVPDFHRRLAVLFPQAVDDTDRIEELAADVMTLRRRLEAAATLGKTAGSAPQPERRARWQFWKREGQ
jgi:hypothetical protein